MSWKQFVGLAAVLMMLASRSADAQIRITEWMYDGTGGAQGGREYIELTNIGLLPVDMTGWSYDDASATPGSLSLSAFGIVLAGESVVISESSAANFRTVWGLPLTVDVIGDNTQNLGRGDQINIFDDMDLLIDSLFYDDTLAPPGELIRTSGISGNPKSLAALGVDDHSQWKYSDFGDVFGSYMSTTGNLGNPGTFATPVPEPAGIVLLLIATAMSALRRHRS